MERNEDEVATLCFWKGEAGLQWVHRNDRVQSGEPGLFTAPPPPLDAPPAARRCSLTARHLCPAEFDLEGLRSKLDEQGLAVAAAQEASVKSRKGLADRTKGGGVGGGWGGGGGGGGWRSEGGGGGAPLGCKGWVS